MEVAWCRVKIGAGWSIALALETVAGSALGLVEFRSHAEVGRPLRRYLDVIGADDMPVELMGKCGHLWTWPLVLDEHDELLGLAEEAGLGRVHWELVE